MGEILPCGRATSVDGAEIHTEEIGSGPVALVLHGGLGVDHHMYRGLDRLAEHLRLVYVDHRANGGSTGDAATATMQQWAADAAALREAMEGTVFRVDAMRRGFEVLAEWSSVDRLDSVQLPVLVLAGRHDAFFAAVTDWLERRALVSP